MSETNYRILSVGEAIMRGDEVNIGPSGWIKTSCYGQEVPDYSAGFYRRKIDQTDGEPKNSEPLISAEAQKIMEAHSSLLKTYTDNEAESDGSWEKALGEVRDDDRVSKIIEERGVVYGNPEDSMRNIGVAWTAILQQHYGITLEHAIPDWVVANMLVAFKLQRTMKGWKLDNYDDAEAYLRFAKSMQGTKEVLK